MESNGTPSGTPGAQPQQPPMPGQQPSSGMATASLVCGILGLFFCLPAPVGLVLGIKAMKKIKLEPQLYTGHGIALAGVITSSISMAWGLLIVPILALIAIPNFINLRHKAYDASAKSAGRNVKVAEELYYYDREGTPGNYTTDLNELLKVDKSLTDDPQVTFVFNDATESGYTFYTTHASGTPGKTFEFHD
jgi:Tfp pilus assembly protein PilE